MSWVDVPDEAVTAGAPASPYLMRALRDNDEAIANSNASFAAMLDPATGHMHGTGTRSATYNFTDLVTVKAGLNDRVPFRFAAPTFGDALYSATVTAGTWELDALATLVQNVMRAAVSGTPASVPLEVVFDVEEGSPTRGLFVIKHTGASGTRYLELHFATGTGAAQGIGPSIGFAKLDRKGAFAYAGDSGFADGYVQDAHDVSEGGLLGIDAWVPGAFTAPKIASNVINARCIQNNAVSGSAGDDKIQDGSIGGAKLNPAGLP